MKEKTASAIGPISTNFSHFKATATDAKMNALMTFFRNFTTEFDVIPESWLTVTDLIILKRSGVHNIDGMRAIQLFDPEFNMINKSLGRQMMRNAELANALSTEQYGSRKKRKAISCCLAKVCFMDTLRQKKHAGAIGMNDLKGNYDRIVHTVAILVLLSFGIHYDTARMMMEVLQLAEHQIKTGYGLLQHLYGGKKGDSVPEMGLGQGNGNASTIWCLISSKMMEVMKRRGHGIDLR